MIHHQPVLLHEVLNFFASVALTHFVDGTIGAGGHAAAVLKAHPEIEHYIALDRDPYALQLAKEKLHPWRGKTSFHHANFTELAAVLEKEKIPKVEGILLDIGVSSMQLDDPERGFSFRYDGPLDMRMDPEHPVTAADIVNECSEEELGTLFRKVGEEKRWRQAARAIAQERKKEPLTTTFQLVDLLKPVLEDKRARVKIHPLTKVFQALRIAVNEELEKLQNVIPEAIDHLQPGGRLAIITFHSLEDRIVKETFRHTASDKENTAGLGGLFIDKVPTVDLITRKPQSPTEAEIAQNPRSRSAKLRGVQKR